jgi:hypothetical protein
MKCTSYQKLLPSSPGGPRLPNATLYNPLKANANPKIVSGGFCTDIILLRKLVQVKNALYQINI